MTITVKTVGATTGRVIIIGDIHGCFDQLIALLRHVKFSNARVRAAPTLLYPLGHEGGGPDSASEDVCISVGDLVNKGPKSFEVVRFIRDIGAWSVLGNHDIKLIRLAQKIRTSTSSTLCADRFSPKELESSLFSLAQSCPEDVLVYLQQLPHVVRVPQFSTLVVHAGLDPSLALAMQDVEAVTRMRNLVKRAKYDCAKEKKDDVDKPLSLSKHYAAFERNHMGKAWARTWSKQVSVQVVAKAVEIDSDTEVKSSASSVEPCQTVCAPEQSSRGEAVPLDVKDPKCRAEYKGWTVVFGHDAKRRLQEYPLAVGLDTGCVYGGALTCLIWPDRSLVSVPGYEASLEPKM